MPRRKKRPGTKKPNARRKRTDEELQHYWREVCYEHEMLVTSYRWLMTNLYEVDKDYEFPIHMESFLVHARNLHEFYYAQTIYIADPAKHVPPKKDDIIAEDYCEGATTWKPPAENQLPDDLIKQIDQRLAHLTYKRTIGNRRDYNYTDIFKRLEATRDVFLTYMCIQHR